MTDHDVSRDNRIPLKYQIADFISHQIEKGNYQPGDQIPTERELSSQFGVSRITVVNALNHLETEGLIVRIQGKGSFVKDTRFTRDLNTPQEGFKTFFEKAGIASNSIVLESSQVIGPLEVTQQLDLHPHSNVVMVRRLRVVDNEPVAITTSFFGAEIGAGLLKYKKGDDISIYEYLANKTGKQVLAGPIYLEPSPLNNAQAKLLQVNVGSCGCITTTTTIIENQTVEYVRSVLRGDKFRFVVNRINYGDEVDSFSGLIL